MEGGREIWMDEGKSRSLHWEGGIFMFEEEFHGDVLWVEGFGLCQKQMNYKWMDGWENGWRDGEVEGLWDRWRDGGIKVRRDLGVDV